MEDCIKGIINLKYSVTPLFWGGTEGTFMNITKNQNYIQYSHSTNFLL